jgi:cysteine-rich repeat protein
MRPMGQVHASRYKCLNPLGSGTPCGRAQKAPSHRSQQHKSLGLSSNCAPCAAGKYKASTGSAPCSDCPTNTFSPAGGSALASCTTITCGDGIRQGLEECDDLNTASSDRCRSTCTVEVGYLFWCLLGRLDVSENGSLNKQRH